MCFNMQRETQNIDVTHVCNGKENTNLVGMNVMEMQRIWMSYGI